MLNFILPRTNIRLYEDISYKHTDKKFPIIGTRNIYIDNINEQINKPQSNWDIMSQIYYPYEFIGNVMQTYPHEEQFDNSNHFFSLRYAMHLELHHFIKHDILYMNNETKTLVFYSDDKYNLNCMNYLKNNNNKNICIKYDSTNIKKILSKNSSSIDHIVIGSHSDDDNEVDYARISYISVLYALCFQKFNGSSIIKLYDIDTPLSIGILGILSSMYLEVHLVKPVTSKSDSSEIFVVCKKFLHKNSNLFYKKFMNIIQNLTKIKVVPDRVAVCTFKNQNNFDLVDAKSSKSKIPELHSAENLNFKIDYQYGILQREAINLQLMNRINEISIIFYQRRLEYIHTLLNTSHLLQTHVNENSTKVNATIKNNIHKCLEWTSKYYKPIIFSSEINAIVLHRLYNRIDI